MIEGKSIKNVNNTYMYNIISDDFITEYMYRSV